MITPPVMRQAGALIADVHTARPENYMSRIVAWAKTDPEQVAQLCVVLARLAKDPNLVSLEDILEALDSVGQDISETTREAHRLYARLQAKKRTHEAEEWVRRGEKLYQRHKTRKTRKARALRALRGEHAA